MRTERLGSLQQEKKKNPTNQSIGRGKRIQNGMWGKEVPNKDYAGLEGKTEQKVRNFTEALEDSCSMEAKSHQKMRTNCVQQYK